MNNLSSFTPAVPFQGGWLRAALIGACAIGIKWVQALGAGAMSPELTILVEGAALGALGLVASSRQLRLGRTRWPLRVMGGAALGAALLLPAAARWTGGPPLWTTSMALALVVISAGEELAFRGALFVALRAAGGAPVAILGSALAFTAGHAFNHGPAFLMAVAGAGLLLGTWRWATGDLVGPILGHAIADLSV